MEYLRYERRSDFLYFRQVVGQSGTGMDLPKHNSLQSSATHRLLSARDLFPPSPSFLEASGITFPFLLRLPGIVADFVVILVLLRIKAKDPRLRLPTWALVIFALSPLSIMVSGYHGNTDPVMVMLLLFSVYFCSRDQPVLSGLFFALSAQVKIVPLLFFPILLCLLDAAPCASALCRPDLQLRPRFYGASRF